MSTNEHVVPMETPQSEPQQQQLTIRSLASTLCSAMAERDGYSPSEIVPVFNVLNQANSFTFDGNTCPVAIAAKWPSVLNYLISESKDDEWIPVLCRIITHPYEMEAVGKNSGMTALHDACIRYPPVHIVKALVTACPEAALRQNYSGETPLHLASYSASEEVQECLLDAAPQAAAIRDKYGDSPLHFAALSGSRISLLQKMVHAYPEAITTPNERGVTPFWSLPRSFVEAENLDQVLNDEGDEDEEDDYRRDWDSMVLFLRYAYYGKERAAEMIAQGQGMGNDRQDFTWLLHAAAATPACPRQVLAFLCRMFPEQALELNEQGYTPLQAAVRATIMDEPGGRNETELEEIQEPVDPSEDHETADSSAQDNEFVDPSQDKPQTDPHLATQEEAGDTDCCQPVENEQGEEKSVVDILLDHSPESALVRDPQGRLPLTSALVAGQSWATVRPLMAACPSAMEETDPVTGFTHAQVAAMHFSDINSVFALVRATPESLKCTTRCSKRSSLLETSDQQPVPKKCRLC